MILAFLSTSSFLTRLIFGLLYSIDPILLISGFCILCWQVIKYLRLILAEAPHLAEYIISCLPDAKDCLSPHLLAKIPKLDSSCNPPEMLNKGTQTESNTEVNIITINSPENQNLSVSEESDDLDSFSQSEPGSYDTSCISNSSVIVTKKHQTDLTNTSQASSEISLVSPTRLNPQLNFTLTEAAFSDIRKQILQEEE